jgi:hypothetical protein
MATQPNPDQQFSAHSVASVDPRPAASELVMIFEHGPNREKVTITLPAGAVGGFAMAIRDALKKLTRSDAERAVVMQPLVVRSASVFSNDYGQVGLALGIENFEVPILVDQGTIDGLRASLDAAESLAKNPPKPPPRNIRTINCLVNRGTRPMIPRNRSALSIWRERSPSKKTRKRSTGPSGRS